VAKRNKRQYIGIELSSQNCIMARKRIGRCDVKSRMTEEATLFASL
jgi:hypothetical protein